MANAPPGATRYRPRTEGLFARIDHYHDAANDYWEVRSKDGLVSQYGTPGAAATDSAVVANPDDPHNVFAWKLTRTSDPFGNQIVYHYVRDAEQLYLSEISYADYDNQGALAFLISVVFHYDQRPDTFAEYRSGFPIRTTQRCTRIDVSTRPGQDLLTRSYYLDYLDQMGLPADQLPLNGASLLARVRVVGHDNVAALPPLTFGYTRFQPELRKAMPIGGRAMPAVSLANPAYALVDLFGHGLPDILEMDSTVRYWRNLGAGRYDLPREMGDAPSGLRLDDPDVQLIDADGDGRSDLLVTGNSLAGYYPARFDGTWDRRSFQPYRQAPSFDLKDPQVHLVDLDSGGVTDALRASARLEWHWRWNTNR